MSAPLLVVDAPYVLYRSFFALPDSIESPDGHPVNALLGATNALLRIAADHPVRAVVICFGAESASYRVERYPNYHADRPPVPDALAWQFERAPAYFERFGWQAIGHDSLEADDLLGSLAAVEAAADGETLIVTGDRDMYQCVDERTAVLYLKSGTTGFERVDAGEVHRRYGIGPELVPDFIALRGDPSDGLPGAPGIGAKTAADLLSRHGSLEAAIQSAASERPRTAAALAEHADDLRGFREIALLRMVTLPRPEDAPTDLLDGARAARELGMTRLATRLEQAQSVNDL